MSPAPPSASGSRRCCRRGEGGRAGKGRGGTEGAQRSFSEAGGARRAARPDCVLKAREGEGPDSGPALSGTDLAPRTRSSLDRAFSGLTLPRSRLPDQIQNPRGSPHPHPVLNTPGWADPAPDKTALPRDIPTYGPAPGPAPPPPWCGRALPPPTLASLQLGGRGAVGGRVLRAAGQQQQVGGRPARSQRRRRPVEAAAGGPARRGREAAAAGEGTPSRDSKWPRQLRTPCLLMSYPSWVHGLAV